MSIRKTIAVFCGSSAGDNPAYSNAAKELGQNIVKHNMTLVYGGAKVGLMGVIADTVLQHGGEVIGVIPRFLAEKEIAHEAITQLHVVETMHERKALITELAESFVMMPGGSGSLEEFFEVWTAAQLGRHTKACAIFNIDNYYQHILKFISHAVQAQFIQPTYSDMVLVDDVPEKLLKKIAEYKAPTLMKWEHVKTIETTVT
jgi:uncharacterized protein (TIGR00730 family)